MTFFKGHILAFKNINRKLHETEPRVWFMYRYIYSYAPINAYSVHNWSLVVKLKSGLPNITFKIRTYVKTLDIVNVLFFKRYKEKCGQHTLNNWGSHTTSLSINSEISWGGQLGLLGGAAPIVFQLLIRGMSLLVLARIGVRVTLPGRRRIYASIVFDQNALMPMVQGLEGRPLWGRAVYTALHGARLSSVPSGDQSAKPCQCSRAQRSLASASLSLFRTEM